MVHRTNDSKRKIHDDLFFAVYIRPIRNSPFSLRAGPSALFCLITGATTVSTIAWGHFDIRVQWREKNSFPLANCALDPSRGHLFLSCALCSRHNAHRQIVDTRAKHAPHVHTTI